MWKSNNLFMDVVFVSNFMNHHQVSLCDALYNSTGGSFLFVETEQMPQPFRNAGYPDLRRAYIVKAWESEEAKQRALELCTNADVLIAGGGKFVIPYEKDRLLNNKLTFEYAERSLKRGWINLFSPTNIKMQFYYHTLFYNRPFYKLCASAYTAKDMYLQHAFKGKCFKFGYFPNIADLNIDDILEKRSQNDCIRILWCARFIGWKHPEMAILLAERLYKRGFDFELNMIGSGPLYDGIKAMIHDKGLSSCVHLLGNCPNEEVLDKMSKHHIFLFTSDRNEGWGAVLNEAMGRGCCPVASHLIGSVPFMLKNKHNGMIFESGDLDSLVKNVEFLLNDRKAMKEMSVNAYSTVRELWNPSVVAERLLNVFDGLLRNDTIDLYKDGPLSKATPISEAYNFD